MTQLATLKAAFNRGKVRRTPCGRKAATLNLGLYEYMKSGSCNGHRINYLTVYSIHSGTGNKQKWITVCACGTKKIVNKYALLYETTKSCGCMWKSLLSKERTIHGRSVDMDKTYTAWCSMHWRCTNKNRDDYKHYGGRGITICNRWDSFDNFLADMGECPDGHSLDRKNNDGNYTPRNVRWATPRQQANNTRKNTLIMLNGKTLTLINWARETGIQRSTIAARLKIGWTPRKALTTPVEPQSNNRPHYERVRTYKRSRR